MNYQKLKRLEYERRDLFERPKLIPRGLSQPKPSEEDGGTGDIDLRPQGHPLLAESVQFQGIDPNMSSDSNNSEHVEHNMSPENAPAATPKKAAELASRLTAKAAPKHTL